MFIKRHEPNAFTLAKKEDAIFEPLKDKIIDYITVNAASRNDNQISIIITRAVSALPYYFEDPHSLSHDCSPGSLLLTKSELGALIEELKVIYDKVEEYDRKEEEEYYRGFEEYEKENRK